jgi:radical SAM protein with 4Fe4S-binding SPASM domain
MSAMARHEGNLIEVVPARASSPEYMQVFTTFRCDSGCGFCFNQGVEGGGDITVDDFRTLVRVMEAGGIREMDVLGGEPALHPEFLMLLDVLAESGLRANLSTNGADVDTLDKIARGHPDGKLMTGVSINSDSISAELLAYIETYKPRLKSVCSRGWTLPRAVRRYLGRADIEFYLLYMDAVSAEGLDDTLPFPEYMDMLSRLKKKYANVEGVHCGFLLEGGLRHVRCPAGTTKLSVMPDGSVYPCYLLFRHGEFRLGNVLEDGLDSIWSNPVLDYFRAFRGNPCKKMACGLRASCHGGCPAVSLLVSGDLHAPDPRCARAFD